MLMTLFYNPFPAVGSSAQRSASAAGGAQTPLERVLACPEADPEKCARLKLLRDRLDPFELSERVDAQIERLQDMASVTRPTRRSRRGRNLNIHRETTLEALRATGAPV